MVDWLLGWLVGGIYKACSEIQASYTCKIFCRIKSATATNSPPHTTTHHHTPPHTTTHHHTPPHTTTHHAYLLDVHDIRGFDLMDVWEDELDELGVLGVVGDVEGGLDDEVGVAVLQQRQQVGVGDLLDDLRVQVRRGRHGHLQALFDHVGAELLHTQLGNICPHHQVNASSRKRRRMLEGGREEVGRLRGEKRN